MAGRGSAPFRRDDPPAHQDPRYTRIGLQESADVLGFAGMCNDGTAAGVTTYGIVHQPGEVPMSKLAVRSVAAAFATALVLSTAAPAFANPSPPTNGGNGAGHSGQCTGNPDDRPASCH
jgi:hypothetical protein